MATQLSDDEEMAAQGQSRVADEIGPRADREETAEELSAESEMDDEFLTTLRADFCALETQRQRDRKARRQLGL